MRIRDSKVAKSVIAIVVVMLMSVGAARKVRAQEPKVIDITAKRYTFSPSTIKLKKGETVTLRLHSEDVVHGFFSRPLKLDETIEPGKTTEVTITPQVAGTFTTICDHFCGAGHGNMAMTIVVE
jgi:cytochrome c oxidase subunit II